jgi:hypothetical protein
MNLWVVGRLRGEHQGNYGPWSIEGVYDSEERAVAVCDNKCFVGPIALNAPTTQSKWPGAWFPTLEDKPVNP